MNKKFAQALLKKESIDENNFTIDFIMTIEVEDRHGDMVDVDTIMTDEYMLNPVVLPSHDHNAKAVGKVIEITKEVIDGKKSLVGKVKFAVEEYDLAKTYWNLYKGGFMNAVSIGFIPESGKEVDGVFILYGSKILELSLVSIPANQLALAKSKGIDINLVVKSIDVESQIKCLQEEMIKAKAFLDISAEDSQRVKEHIEDNSKENIEKEPETKEVKKKKKTSSLLAKAIRELNK